MEEDDLILGESVCLEGTWLAEMRDLKAQLTQAQERLAVALGLLEEHVNTYTLTDIVGLHYKTKHFLTNAASQPKKDTCPSYESSDNAPNGRVSAIEVAREDK